MKRPLLIVAISYILGIIIGVYFKTGIPIILLIGVIIISLILINNKQIYNKEIYINDLRINNKSTKLNINKINNYIKAIILILITIIVSYTKTICLNKKYDSFYEKFNRRRNNACGNNMQ